MYKYQEERGVSDRTLDGLRIAIGAFFEWCVESEILQRNVTKSIKPIRYEEKQREALNQYELEILRKACKNDRERAILEFMYSTGCRCAELTNVTMDDLNLKDGTVHLFGKGKKHRTSYLNAKCVFAVQQYLTSRKFDSVYLFGSAKAPHGKITVAAVERIIGNLAVRVDGKITKSVTPHVLRHTTATQALRSGMPLEEIQLLLGHENIQTTRIYAEVDAWHIKADHLKYVV